MTSFAQATFAASIALVIGATATLSAIASTPGLDVAQDIHPRLATRAALAETMAAPAVYATSSIRLDARVVAQAIEVGVYNSSSERRETRLQTTL